MSFYILMDLSVSRSHSIKCFHSISVWSHIGHFFLNSLGTFILNLAYHLKRGRKSIFSLSYSLILQLPVWLVEYFILSLITSLVGYIK